MTLNGGKRPAWHENFRAIYSTPMLAIQKRINNRG